jgi:hypothetical protein
MSRGGDWEMTDNTDMFAGVESFLMFIGYPRSGHSLIGSLLDAHPNMMVANEYNVLRHISNYHGDNLPQYIFSGIYDNCKQYQGKRIQSGYNYTVPNQYQGSYKNYISVIGDKKGGITTGWFIKNHEAAYGMLKAFQRKINKPIKCVHIYRNPFDNIASMALRRHCKSTGLTYSTTDFAQLAPIKVDDSILEEKIYKHFGRVQKNEELSQLDIWESYQLSTEDFIESPALELSRLCDFLSVFADSQYLEDGASIVMKRVKRTRRLIEWPERYIERIQINIEKYQILTKYRLSQPF